jgi:hypothetical protein
MTSPLTELGVLDLAGNLNEMVADWIEPYTRAGGYQQPQMFPSLPLTDRSLPHVAA